MWDVDGFDCTPYPSDYGRENSLYDRYNERRQNWLEKPLPEFKDGPLCIDAAPSATFIYWEPKPGEAGYQDPLNLDENPF